MSPRQESHFRLQPLSGDWGDDELIEHLSLLQERGSCDWERNPEIPISGLNIPCLITPLEWLQKGLPELKELWP